MTTASVSGATRVIGAQKPVVASATTPSPLRWVAGPAGRPPANIGSTTPAPKLARVETRPEPPKPVRTADKVEKAEKSDKAARGKSEKADKTEKADKAEKSGKSEVARKDAKEQAPVRSGTMIQIGATDDIAKANALIARARAESRSKLASAQSYTEKVQKGDSTLYRARFAGLETGTAEAACRELKRSGFACFTTKN
ncbi:MAG: SPOR domain-containing protein [Rhizobiales bacterium]|nr:SPOR domain-containing protein [Hyphomicrobiales bacterium]